MDGRLRLGGLHIFVVTRAHRFLGQLRLDPSDQEVFEDLRAAIGLDFGLEVFALGDVGLGSLGQHQLVVDRPLDQQRIERADRHLLILLRQVLDHAHHRVEADFLAVDARGDRIFVDRLRIRRGARGIGSGLGGQRLGRDENAERKRGAQITVLNHEESPCLWIAGALRHHYRQRRSATTGSGRHDTQVCARSAGRVDT
ncbi:MAG: hypothetical protein ACMVY4_22475 [Minwuia sp.]|uniref:hypothetical protein n=1 Tax=Minwuia sp. TaxID=2493630 RepID=UPI003A86F549